MFPSTSQILPLPMVTTLRASSRAAPGWLARAVVAAAVGAMAIGLGACAGGGGGGGVGGGAEAGPRQPVSALVRGDWDDLEAAVWTAADKTETAVERIEWEEEGDGEFRATLRTVRSEPISIRARREGRLIALAVQVGHFEDPDPRAGRLLEAIEERLEQLEGVGYAPVE